MSDHDGLRSSAGENGERVQVFSRCDKDERTAYRRFIGALRALGGDVGNHRRRSRRVAGTLFSSGSWCCGRPRMSLWWSLVQETVISWLNHKAAGLGLALAFY